MRLIHLLLVVALLSLVRIVNSQQRRSLHSSWDEFDGDEDPVYIPEYEDEDVYEKVVDIRAVRGYSPTAKFTKKSDEAKVSEDKENRTSAGVKVRGRSRFQPSSPRSETTTTRGTDTTSKVSKYTRQRQVNTPRRPYTTTQKPRNSPASTPDSQYSWRKDIVYGKNDEDQKNPPRRYESRNRTMTKILSEVTPRGESDSPPARTTQDFTTKISSRTRDPKKSSETKEEKRRYNPVQRESRRGRIITTTESTATTAVKFVPTTTTRPTTTTQEVPSTTAKKIVNYPTTTSLPTTRLLITTKLPTTTTKLFTRPAIVTKASTTTTETPSKVSSFTRVSLESAADQSKPESTKESTRSSPPSRGNAYSFSKYSPNSSASDDSDEEENYPEHFKKMLRQMQEKEKGASVVSTTEKPRRVEPTRPRFIPRERPTPSTTSTSTSSGLGTKVKYGGRDNADLPLKQAKRVKLLENFKSANDGDNSIPHTFPTTSTTTTQETPSFVPAPKRSKVVVQESYSKISTQSSVERRKPAKAKDTQSDWRSHMRKPPSTVVPVTSTTPSTTHDIPVTTAKYVQSFKSHFNPFPKDFDDFGTFSQQFSGRTTSEPQHQNAIQGNYVNFHLPTVSYSSSTVSSQLPTTTSRYSSRYRNIYRAPASSFVSQRHGPSAAIGHPVYIPTIPSIRTTHSTTQQPVRFLYVTGSKNAAVHSLMKYLHKLRQRVMVTVVKAFADASATDKALFGSGAAKAKVTFGDRKIKKAKHW
ncbi:mucin-5AC-like [Phlebotomus argentipes]|uniref:mucin-5AC-like n=1 Tax=Phlebotomus argentipes TaxID=94469 RepID=UPI0028934C01|nr:mucin-5AC-like [Phlebotomus argentipes]